MPVSPQKRRQAARKRLSDRSKAVAARVLADLNMAPGGYDIARLLPEVKGSANRVASIRLINLTIATNLGVGKNERNKVTADKTEEAYKDLDKIGDEVKQKIEDAKNKKI